MAGANPKETAIIGNIEKRLGPVGKGHHNSHRTAHLLEWLRKKKSPAKGSGSAPATHAKVLAQFAKKGGK